MNNNQHTNNALHRDFEMVSPTDRKLSMLMYILGLITWIVGPIILFLLFKQQSSYFVKQGKDFFNFQFSYIAYLFILLFFIDAMPPLILAVIVLAIMMNIFYVVGAIKMYKGKEYLAPLSLRFFK